MWQIARFGLVTALAAMIVCPLAYGRDLPEGMTFGLFVGRHRRDTNEDRAALFVQKTADFCLRNGDQKIVPGGVGYVCRLERVEGDQSLVVVRTQSLRGWVATGQLIPLNHAEAFFTKQIEANPRDAFAFLMRGAVRYENDDIDRAFTDLNESLRLDPACASTWIRRGYVWQYRDRLDLALADAEEAIRLDPRASYSYIDRGIFHFGAGAIEKAMSDFDQAGRLGSRAAMLPVWRGMVYLQTKKWDLAIAEFERGLEIDRQNLDIYLLLGMAYMFQPNVGKAITKLNRAIAGDPKFARAYEERAVCSISRGKYRDALRDLNEADRLEPNTIEYLALRARLCYEMQDYKQSLADLESGLRLAPDNAAALQSLAWFLAFCPDQKFHDTKRALDAATRSCELSQWKKTLNLVTLAAVDSEIGDFEGAAKWQQKAIDSLEPNDPDRPEYQKDLKRYQARKPYHRLGLFEEIGLSFHGVFARNSASE